MTMPGDHSFLETPGEELPRLAEKTVQQPVKASTLAYCPTLDLLALATVEEKVYVYRLNGQRVVGGASKTPGLSIQTIHWKPNGQLLAVAWSDNHVRLISPETNRVIHEINISLAGESSITCLGWGTSLPQGSAGQSRAAASGQGLDSLFRHATGEHASDALPDLPRDLASLDIEGAIPKLSLLPSGKDEDAFSSRATMDAMFSPLKGTEDEAVDVLVAGLSPGKVYVTVYNCFEIGLFHLSTASRLLSNCRPTLHRSHPSSSTHTLLLEQQGCTYFVPMDLRFLSLSASGEHLSLLASKSTQLQNLLRYITQVQVIMLSEWKACQELPNRFIQSFNDISPDSDFVHATYHLAASGHCWPEMKEWLVDILSERGHKRWEKSISSGYELIRRMVHEHLLPALERCAVVVCRLRGLCRYQHSNSSLGLSLTDLNSVLDSTSCLTLLAHHILHRSGVEARLFTSFSTWLRHEIDVQSYDPGSSSNDPAEKDIEIDYPKLLDYIKGPMMNSYLSKFLASDSSTTEGSIVNGECPTYEVFKKSLAKLECGRLADERVLGLRELTSFLARRCRALFVQIAEAQKRNVLFGAPIQVLADDAASITDMKMLMEDDTVVAYIAARGNFHTHRLFILRIVLRVENGLSSVSAVEAASMGVGSGVIKDIRFVDDEHLLCLWQSQDATHLLKLSYKPSTGNPSRPAYVAWTPPRTQSAGPGIFTQEPSTTIADGAIFSNHIRHTFPADSFRPAHIEVNGRKGRRVVCVLSQDRQRYKIFDLGEDQASNEHGEDEPSLDKKEDEDVDMMSG